MSLSNIKTTDTKRGTIDGGTFTLGAWRTRDLSLLYQFLQPRLVETDVTPPQASLLSNQFTLPAGTYRIFALPSCGGGINACKSRLRNITDGTTTIVGQNDRSSSWAYNTIIGRFSIAAPKTFEIQHQGQSTTANTGFGNAVGLATVAEVYTQVVIWRIAAAEAYAKYSDVKANGTDGGDFNNGAWRTRVLNTEDVDIGNHGVLAANQITLDPGTYEVTASTPSYSVTGHRCRLRNITDGTTLAEGVNARNDNAGSSAIGFMGGQFTTPAYPIVVELQDYCRVTKAGNGFGINNNFLEGEIYSLLELRKVA